MLAAELAAEPAVDMLPEAEDGAVDTVDDIDMLVDPVAVELPTAVAVWPGAQEAAVGRFVTPAGMQTLSAYLIVAFWSAWSQTFATQHVIALMKPASEQMHFGSRLHELGIAFSVQFCAHLGRALKLCAETNEARSAVTTTAKENMMKPLNEVDCKVSIHEFR